MKNLSMKKKSMIYPKNIESNYNTTLYFSLKSRPIQKIKTQKL